MGMDPLFHFPVFGDGCGQKYFAPAGNGIGGIQCIPAFTASAAADNQRDKGSVFQNIRVLSFCSTEKKYKIPYSSIKMQPKIQEIFLSLQSQWFHVNKSRSFIT
jgi:hypothetical protein